MTKSAPVPRNAESKIFALLGYLSILCIFPLLFKKDDPFVLAHAKQGLVLFIGQVAMFILSIILPWVLVKVLVFFLFVLAFIGIIKALMGQYVDLPIAADIADKISLS
ncbi:MAG: hypothetical protein ACLFPX_03375 [Candidatus Omnitrophota bacterium]